MLYYNVRVMAYYLRFLDAVAVGVASAATWWIGVRLEAWSLESTWEAMAVFSFCIALAFAAMGGRTRMYHAWRTEHLVQELAVLCEVALYAAGLACVASEILTSGLPGQAYAAMLVTNTATLMGLRVTMRVVIRRLRRRGRDYRIWLIVGHNARAFRLAEAILANPHFGILIDEVVDLADKPDTPVDGRRLPYHLLRSVSTSRIRDVEAIRDIVKTRVIDEVVVTLPVRSYYDEIQQILDMCCEAGISVKLQPEGFERAGYKTEISQVGSIPMVTHFTGPSNQTQLAVKRAIDVVGAAIGLTVLFPLFVLIILATRLSSRGPIFFSQTRVGLHGRYFRMMKFRSMTKDAAKKRAGLESFNESDGTAFKIKDDPRITPVGRILRRFHLDELPQLWNVLLGDMSLVGPRPLPPEEAHGNEWWQRRRLSMPPGLTCFWQVIGDHKMPFRRWMQLDLAYIDRWSVWLDLRILASTFVTVIQGKGW